MVREFQLNEIAPIIPLGSFTATQVYNSESFVENLGEAHSRFRMGPPTRLPPERE
jgi:hypothetical protein